jgi:hypothetical protein
MTTVNRTVKLALWVLVEHLKDTDRTERMGIKKDNIKMYFNGMGWDDVD